MGVEVKRYVISGCSFAMQTCCRSVVDLSEVEPACTHAEHRSASPLSGRDRVPDQHPACTGNGAHAIFYADAGDDGGRACTGKGRLMAERILPGGRPWKPRWQPRERPPPSAAAAPARTPVRLAWRTGDKVLWNGYTGTFLRETVDDHAEVLIGTRTYRVRKAELQST